MIMQQLIILKTEFQSKSNECEETSDIIKKAVLTLMTVSKQIQRL